MAFRGQDIYTGTEQVQHLANDSFLVFGQVNRKLHSREMCLEQDESFEVWRIVRSLRHLDWNAIVDSSQDVVLMATHLDRFKLGGGSDNLEHAFELRSSSQRQQESLHGYE